MPDTTPATAETPTEAYALGRDPEESARLQRQSGELRADSAALLDRVGLGPGQAAIDLGCGPSGIIELLAERVAPGGRVVGLDADPVHVALARELIRQRGLGEVEIVAADARCTGLPSGSFDLVHARTLLVTVPDAARVLAEMARLARPGGWIASLEPHTEYSLCYPPHPGWTRVSEIFRAAFSRNGADLLIGRHLTELYREAGLRDIGTVAIDPLIIRTVMVKVPDIIEYQVRQTDHGIDVAIVADGATDHSALASSLGHSLRAAGLPHPHVHVRDVAAIERHAQSGKTRRFIVR